jgi:uncharacterized protein (TIGR03437 family)
MRAIAVLLSIVLWAGAASAQLIPSGTPVPQTTLPPVVFINGFQFDGCPTSFANTFGIADQVLQNNGEVSLFFNTCTLAQSASIEDLGAALGTFLSGLTYTNGQPVTQVDVVAHSMGGLVLRAYLSGKQNTAGVFQPPATVNVRKAVFLSTPHFGTGIASLLPILKQVDEMASGSAFLFDLATWNDGADDLRGVDAIAETGNGGTGLMSGTKGFDDGVVALTSGSLQFYGPGRTRVVPYCHVSGGGLVSDVGLCSGSAQGIADITSATHDSALIITSFFNGTTAWQSVGTAAEDDKFLSVDGGLIIAADTAADTSLNINSATANSQKLSISSDHLAFTDMITAGTLSLAVTSGTTNLSSSITLPAGGYEPYTVKTGPLITRVYSAAAANFPLELAPDMLIAIYGSDLADQTAGTDGATFPTQLADAQVMVSGSAVPLYYVSATQINAVLPSTITGLVPLTVVNSAGQSTVNLYIETAAPAIFTQDSSGSGPAAALLAPALTLVTASNPLQPGDYVALYLTGLGAPSPSDIVGIEPTVTVEGLDCPVSYAGTAPGYVGLDQINCQIPANATPNTSAPVVVTSGNRTSNTVTLAIQ